MKNCEKFYPHVTLVIRVLFGLMFFMHGLGKIMGGKVTSAFWPMGAAGIIEVVVGAFLILGLFVKWSSFVGFLTMGYAYLFFHAAGAGWSLLPFDMFGMTGNGGEKALVYMFVFLLLKMSGPGICAIDNKMKKA